MQPSRPRRIATMKYQRLAVLVAVVISMPIITGCSIANSEITQALKQQTGSDFTNQTPEQAKKLWKANYEQLFRMPIDQVSDFKTYYVLEGFGDHDNLWGFTSPKVEFGDPSLFKVIDSNSYTLPSHVSQEDASAPASNLTVWLWVSAKSEASKVFVIHNKINNHVIVHETDDPAAGAKL